MTKTPEDCVNDVVDEATFVEFLKSLADDWERERELEKVNPSSPYGPGALGWENGSIGQFLECAAACAEDNGLGREAFYGNPWRAAAEILLGGKTYE